MSQMTIERLGALRRRHRRSSAWRTAALAAAVAALWSASLMIGETFYSPHQVWDVLMGRTVPGASFALGELRLPRATIGAAVGIAFGTAGATFQSLLRNQLASPDIIGISGAASVAGATAIILFHASAAVVSTAALLFSLLTAAVVYLLVPAPRSGARLILIGIGISAMLHSWTSYVLSRAAAWDVPTAARWLTGSLNSASFEQGWPALAAAAVALPLGVLASNRVGLLRFDDGTVQALGVAGRTLRPVLLAAAVALVAAATSAAGPIAFVAFTSGPIAARLFPSRSAHVLQAGLVGAFLVLAADAAGQFAFGTRYPVGVITGVVGAPILIALLIRSRPR